MWGNIPALFGAMDLESMIKNLCESLSVGAFSNLFTNPIYVSLLITSIVVLVVLCMYDDDRVMKTTTYIFFATAFVVFVHNKLLLIEHRRQLCDRDSDNICNKIGDGPAVGGDSSAGLAYLSV